MGVGVCCMTIPVTFDFNTYVLGPHHVKKAEYILTCSVFGPFVLIRMRTNVMQSSVILCMPKTQFQNLLKAQRFRTLNNCQLRKRNLQMKKYNFCRNNFRVVSFRQIKLNGALAFECFECF